MQDDETLEIVNQSNQVVGQSKRQAIHRSGLWHRGVHIFLFLPNRKLLVQKRSKYKAESPKTLDCSVSEHIKPGESYLEGAIRGLHEELGIEPVTLKYLMKFKMNYGAGDNMISELYEGTIAETTVRTDLKETSKIDYYRLSELEKQLVHGDMAFSHWFKELLLWYLGKPSEVEVIANHQ
jgi:isopentenyl-diphosphate delta-isomerase type 1